MIQLNNQWIDKNEFNSFEFVQKVFNELNKTVDNVAKQHMMKVLKANLLKDLINSPILIKDEAQLKNDSIDNKNKYVLYILQ